MHILYVDESGDTGTSAGSTKHLVLTGAAMPEAQWLDLTRLMDSIQAAHFPQAGGQIELHASPLRAGRGDFRGLPECACNAAVDAVFGKIGEPQNGLTLFSSSVTNRPSIHG